MKIAVVGAGISGLMAARLLDSTHEVTLFEAAPKVGGHVETVEVPRPEGTVAVDTGFIVFTHAHYPHFTRMLDEVGVASRHTDMSFSVRDDRSGVELALPGLGALFAQRRNLVRPGHLALLRELIRFCQRAAHLLEREGDRTVAELLSEQRFHPELGERYLVPLACALWSAPPAVVRRFSARHVVGFLHSHGMLRFFDRPKWRTVVGGSRVYVDALVRRLRAKLRLDTPIDAVTRTERGVSIRPQGGSAETFHAVILAVHSDQALRLLGDPSDDERQVLGAIAYQPNEVVLHTDTHLLPRSPRAWASWNYLMTGDEDAPATVTYDLTRLMGLTRPERYLVTLNALARMDPSKVIRRLRFDHPLFTRDAIAAQAQRARICGERRTFYCGAYWGNGFHEDGARSALEAVARLKERLG